MAKEWIYVIDQAVKKIEEDEIELGLAALKKIQEHGKELPDVMLYLADVWYRLGHVQEAKGLLEEILQSPQMINQSQRQEAQLLLAEVALSENDLEYAQTLLYQLKEAGYEELELYLMLADLYAMQDLDEVAVTYLEQAFHLEPENQQLAAALVEMYMRIGRQREAMEILDDMTEPDMELLMFQGRALAQSGELERAYAVFRKALELEKTAETFYACGLMAFHLGLLNEAAVYIENLFALDEEYMAGYPLLSDIYLSLGKTEKAIQTLMQYVELSGFDLEQIRKLIALLQQAGRYEEAKHYQQLQEAWDTEEE